MSSATPVAVDAMGGDGGPESRVKGAQLAARQGLPVVLCGQESVLRPLLNGGPDLPILDAAEVFGMDDSPSAVRRRAETSIRRATRAVCAGEASSVVSCGHSGATLVSAVVDLGLIDPRVRPAIATVLPIVEGRELVLLDAGANVDCKSEHLARFADLGAAFAEVRGVHTPRVGLLANGEEPGKGNALTRGAFELIRSSKLNFVGNIEPHRALAGGCDVLVCDGYAGNAVLKAAEGAVSVVGTVLRAELRRSWRTRLGAWLAAPAFGALKRRVSWDAHGGALLLGVDGVVVVGHGRANPEAVGAAIRLAHYCSRHSLVDGVRRHLSR